MKILVGKTFGLGNAVMSLPMIKAIRSLPEVEQLDVLIGTTQDDGGAKEVFSYLHKDGTIDNLYYNDIHCIEYDVAIMSVPFDGRWRNGVHFSAKRVLDGRTRPDPSTTGLISWKKHEIEYQMENAYELGYEGEIPDTSFYPIRKQSLGNTVYFGVGYKKDANNFWSKKHWGNSNFIGLARKIISKSYFVMTTGNILDYNIVIGNMKLSLLDKTHMFRGYIQDLHESFETLSTCEIYVGNDTGMMHVAASMGIPCITPFFLENSTIKNHAWGDNHVSIDGFGREVSVDEVFSYVKRMLR